ncbi:MAG: hypothetical protein AB1641_11400 [Thermodesulfobacteriota bacterium]
MLDVATSFDLLSTYCLRLGGPVTFGYCRGMADGRPCGRSLICWERMFPVDQYMSRILTEDEWREVFEATSPGRLETILREARKAEELNKNR